MLSGETAAGRFPVEAAATMARIAAKTDAVLAKASREEETRAFTRVGAAETTFARAIGQAASRIADSIDATCLACFTMSGYSARMISRYRPSTPIIAITHREDTRRRCALSWGVDAIMGSRTSSLNDMVVQVDDLLTQHELARYGDTLVIVAGTPLLVGGRTNILKIHRVGEDDAEIGV
jgi:pyruvate kinase